MWSASLAIIVATCAHSCHLQGDFPGRVLGKKKPWHDARASAVALPGLLFFVYGSPVVYQTSPSADQGSDGGAFATLRDTAYGSAGGGRASNDKG